MLFSIVKYNKVESIQRNFVCHDLVKVTYVENLLLKNRWR